jgi:tRNA pseudouridine13 synthase
MLLPYLTADAPGIGGRLKQRVEDFFVQEVPAYEPSGAGEHVYCEIQKVGIPTFAVVDRIARGLNVPTRAIGYAGLKDARAVARQVLSIHGVTEAAVMGLRLPQLQVLWASRHTNKLRIGHLRGNRFAIKIRDVEPTHVVRVRPLIDLLEQRGMPNYFGEQRFGRRGNNDQLGAALIRGDDRALLGLLLGDPRPNLDDGQTLEARTAFAAHDLEASMNAWPRRCGMERRILARLMKTHKPSAAVRAVDERMRHLWVSALQSRVFNEVVARRIQTIDRLIPGDFAIKHENNAGFAVPDPAIEQPRCAAWEISPTGPIVGYRMTLPTDEALAIEQAALDEHQLQPEDFRQSGKHRVKGTRRPLRVRPTDVRLEGGVDEHAGHITVAFTLPAGSFATVLLREIMKNDQADDESAAAQNAGDAEASAADAEADDEQTDAPPEA